jgi:Zn-dependent M28 family amino/carboxypeptidase
VIPAPPAECGLQLPVRRWVEALCSEECAGREPGTPEGAAARAVIVDALRAMGHSPEELPIPASGGVNVLARIGGGPRWVLVGAHYDHLGRSGDDAFWGADDNAAAVAVLLELGRVLSAAPPEGRGVLLVAFDCEEPPYFLTHGMGSDAFVRRPPLPLSQVELAVILDLVGHAVGPDAAPAPVRDSLFALGAEKSAGTGDLLARAAAGSARIVIRRADIDIIPPLSDYEPFRRAGVPFVFLTCGRWRHYHTVTDTPDRLDYVKLAGVAGFVEKVVRLSFARETPPVPVYDDDARDHAGTVATLLALAQDLRPFTPRAAMMAAQLEAIQRRMDPQGRCSLPDWSAVLQIIALLEQGLA